MAVTVTLVVIGTLVALAYDVVLLLFTAIVLAVALRGASERVAGWTGWSPAWALGGVLAGLLLLAGIFGWLAAPGLARQSDELSRTLPASIQRAREWVEQRPLGRYLLPGVMSGSASTPSSPTGDGGARIGTAARFFTTTFGAAGNLVIVVVIALYLAFDPALYAQGVIGLVPPRRRARAAAVLEACGTALRQWMSGQLVAMGFTGLATAIGLSLLGVPLALLLGVLAGLLNVVPFVGPIIAAVPAMLMALTVSPATALYVGVFFVVLQSIEGNIITPVAQRRATNVPPGVLVALQLLMGVLFGFLGVLTAAPLASVGKVLVRQLYLEEVLEEPAETASAER